MKAPMSRDEARTILQAPNQCDPLGWARYPATPANAYALIDQSRTNAELKRILDAHEALGCTMVPAEVARILRRHHWARHLELGNV